ncbi:hypothetical protein D7X30_33470 [Corallococcus sp. AB011P]|uniref:hypothetical protein n=1 Tax=Corallococcus sp. AB045 TaxID=2316719 RepID=UPI000EA121BB|nr:hypothetical protein [Corallococcus sp. AB045]RKG52518.1 hypothetical protein D7X30_33470 [Corallococcus sp. AB011P]RKH88114.1 hypothetical protein D7Y21_16310 [Corallococcus sp. AB045]
MGELVVKHAHATPWRWFDKTYEIELSRMAPLRRMASLLQSLTQLAYSGPDFALFTGESARDP